MRFLMKVLLPVEVSNAAVKDGSLPKTIQSEQGASSILCLRPGRHPSCRFKLQARVAGRTAIRACQARPEHANAK